MSSEAALDQRRATPSDVAKHLNTTPQTINKWARQGVIPVRVREGKVIRFDLAEVDAALAERAKQKGAR